MGYDHLPKHQVIPYADWSEPGIENLSWTCECEAGSKNEKGSAAGAGCALRARDSRVRLPGPPPDRESILYYVMTVIHFELENRSLEKGRWTGEGAASLAVRLEVDPRDDDPPPELPGLEEVDRVLTSSEDVGPVAGILPRAGGLARRDASLRRGPAPHGGHVATGRHVPALSGLGLLPLSGTPSTAQRKPSAYVQSERLKARRLHERHSPSVGDRCGHASSCAQLGPRSAKQTFR